MSYHIESKSGFKDLPKRILVREDGYLGAYRFYGEPIVDYWYVPESKIEKLEAENAKLRELARDMHTLATDHGVYVRYPYCDTWDEKLAVVEKQMRELGIEVDE